MNKSPTNTGRKGEHLHDSMAKTYFGNPQNMANFLEQCLPAHMVEALDLESLESSAETFVDDAFKQYIADLVFTSKPGMVDMDPCISFSNTNRSPNLYVRCKY